jgi:hypothetical protein
MDSTQGHHNIPERDHDANEEMRMPMQKARFVPREAGNVAYLSLPGHPQKVACGAVNQTVRLLDLVENYKGPDVYLDFDKDGMLIGLEFLFN